MRATSHDGTLYLSASEIPHETGYNDVTPRLLRSWVTAGHLNVVTTGELAAALGRPLPADVDPAAPVRAPGPQGPENVYRWPDVVTAETHTRRTRRARGGRTRKANT